MNDWVRLMLPVLDGVDEEVDEPCQRILIHGVYIRQVGYGEEKVSRVLSYGSVAHSRRLYLLFCLVSYLICQSQSLYENQM